MKVIFLQDVPRVAYAGDIKEVADGYARNYLIPKQLAAVAKPGAINMVAARQAKMVTEFSGLANKIEGLEINLKARVGAKDRLFGAITAADIATELNSTAEVEIDKRKIVLDKPIHELGEYEIAIRLAKDLVPKIKVTVSKEVTAEEVKEQPQGAATEEEKEQPQEVTAEEVKEQPQGATTEEEKEQPQQEAAVEAEKEEPQETTAEEAKSEPQQEAAVEVEKKALQEEAE
jgi:large subunit ribosomal protein L9